MDDRSPEEKEFDKIEAITSYQNRRIRADKLMRLREKIGVCATCVHFTYLCTVLESEEFWCERNCGESGPGLPIRLRVTGDPLRECSRHRPRGELSLYRMQDMAVLINIKRPLGFNPQVDRCPEEPEKDT